MSEIPQWAINEALKRCGVAPTQIPFVDWRDRTYAKAVELFAAHIAEHEEPPVDSVIAKTAAAFEALWNENEYGTVERWAGRLQMLLSAQGLKIVEASDV